VCRGCKEKAGWIATRSKGSKPKPRRMRTNGIRVTRPAWREKKGPMTTERLLARARRWVKRHNAPLPVDLKIEMMAAGINAGAFEKRLLRKEGAA
jgi:hypothetical protein